MREQRKNFVGKFPCPCEKQGLSSVPREQGCGGRHCYGVEPRGASNQLAVKNESDGGFWDGEGWK